MGIPLGHGEPVVVAPRGHRGVVAALGGSERLWEHRGGGTALQRGNRDPSMFPSWICRAGVRERAP